MAAAALAKEKKVDALLFLNNYIKVLAAFCQARHFSC